MRNPFRYFNSSPEVIRLTVMLYIRYPLSLRQVEDLLLCWSAGSTSAMKPYGVEPLRPDVRHGGPEQAIGGSNRLAQWRWDLHSQTSERIL